MKLEPLPTEWIERIFMRLHGRFGNPFLDKFRTNEINASGGDVGIENAKVVWSQELAGVNSARITNALRASYTYPPSCDDFKRNCVATPAEIPVHVALPKPEISQEELDEKLKKMNATMSKFGKGGANKNWAYTLIQAHKNGFKVVDEALRKARLAVGGMEEHGA